VPLISLSFLDVNATDYELALATLGDATHKIIYVCVPSYKVVKATLVVTVVCH